MMKTPYILDEIKGCVAAYDLNRISQKHVGNLAKVRNTSYVSKDIGSCGKYLDASALNQFSSTPYLKTIYDQLTGKSIDVVNLFAEHGSFEGDLSKWFAWNGSAPQGGATGITEISAARSKFGSKSLHVLMVNQGGGIQKDFAFTADQASIGDQIYVCAWVYKVSGTLINPVLRVFDYQALTNGVSAMTPTEYANAPTGQWVLISTVKPLVTQGIRVYTNGAAYSSYEMYIDEICIVNLSKAGLSQSEMDAITKTEVYFTSKRISIRENASQENIESSQPILSPTAMTFDGLDDYLSIPSTEELDITQAPLSIVARFNCFKDGYILAKNLDSAANIQYGIYLNTLNLAAFYLEGLARISIQIELNIWNTIVFTWDGNNVKCYLNGVLYSVGNYVGNLTSRPFLAIGRRGAVGYFSGRISHISIWNKVLSGSDVLKLTKALNK